MTDRIAHVLFHLKGESRILTGTLEGTLTDLLSTNVCILRMRLFMRECFILLLRILFKIYSKRNQNPINGHLTKTIRNWHL